MGTTTLLKARNSDRKIILESCTAKQQCGHKIQLVQTMPIIIIVVVIKTKEEQKPEEWGGGGGRRLRKREEKRECAP